MERFKSKLTCFLECAVLLVTCCLHCHIRNSLWIQFSSVVYLYFLYGIWT